MRRPPDNKWLWPAIAAFALLAVILVMFSGCGTAPKVPVELAPGVYEVPATPSADGATIAGHEEADRIATIVVPLPDGTKATARVYKKKVPLLRRAFTNAPAVSVVSDSPSVTVQTPKKTLWWRWALLFAFAAGAGYFLWRKLKGFAPWPLAWRLITRIFRRQ